MTRFHASRTHGTDDRGGLVVPAGDLESRATRSGSLRDPQPDGSQRGDSSGIFMYTYIISYHIHVTHKNPVFHSFCRAPKANGSGTWVPPGSACFFSPDDVLGLTLLGSVVMSLSMFFLIWFSMSRLDPIYSYNPFKAAINTSNA